MFKNEGASDAKEEVPLKKFKFTTYGRCNLPLVFSA